MPHSFTIGRWHRDGKTGKWTKRKSNRKKDWWEFEGRTKAQRARDRKARQKRSEDLGKARTARAAAKAEAKKKARYERDKARASRDRDFRERAESKAQAGPAPTVTQTGARTYATNLRAHAAQCPRGATGGCVLCQEASRTVPGEVVAARVLTPIESAGLCGAPNKTGGRCMRAVAPGSRCPVHKAGAKPQARSGAGVR